MEKGVTEKTTAGEGEQDFKEILFFFGVIKRDKEKDEKGGGADKQGGSYGFQPEIGVALGDRRGFGNWRDFL